MTPENARGTWSARARRVIIWGDLYLVDFAAVVPWFGLVSGQLLSPTVGRTLGASSDIILAGMVAISTSIGSYLLIRMLQKNKLASPAYLNALSMMVENSARDSFDARVAWILKWRRPMTRADALNTYRAAQKDTHAVLDDRRAASISGAL
jgi:hypothetical protein